MMSSNINSGFIGSNSGFIDINTQASGFVPDGSQAGCGYIDTLMSQGGAMGSLYCRTYASSGLREVVKRIKPEHANDREFRDLLVQEYNNLKRLCHENIVAARQQGEDSQGLWYSMEYIDGATLSQLIASGEAIQTADKVEILSQILSGLQYVHRIGVIHRDLKPDNIMVGYRNRNVKIIDFGLAISDSYAQRLRLAGSQKYMSPEQKIDSSIINQQSDIYSFGLIMVEFLTGRYSESAQGIEDARLRAIASKCLCTDLISRYHNCSEIISELSTSKSDIPAEVSRLVDEIAADGVVSKSEREYLDMMISKHKLDPAMVNALLNYKLEKNQPQPQAPMPAAQTPMPAAQASSGKPKKRRVKWGAVAITLLLIAGIAALAIHWTQIRDAVSHASQQPDKNEQAPSDAQTAWQYYREPEHYAQAAEIFREMSQSSNQETKIDGLRGLALCYAYGRGVTQSPAVALKYIDQALDIDPKRVSLLDTKGTIYAQIGDYQKASEYWAICQEKDPEYINQKTDLTEYFIWIDEGDQYYNEGKFDDAVKSYQKAADLNNPYGMCYIADCYMEGKGVDPNPEIAFEYYKKAAECRIPEAMLKLGQCFLKGKGTTRDRSAGQYWIKMAAEQGSAEANTVRIN